MAVSQRAWRKLLHEHHAAARPGATSTASKVPGLDVVGDERVVRERRSHDVEEPLLVIVGCRNHGATLSIPPGPSAARVPG